MVPAGSTWARAVVLAICVAGCASNVPPALTVTGGVVRDDSPRATEERAPGTRPATVSSGDLVTARYLIRNSGGRDLLLHGLTLACGCRLASSVPDALAPDEQATVAVRCRAPRTPGDVVREIRLHSNDPARPEERLRVPMTVAAGGDADPPALYLGYVPVGGSAARELVVGGDRPSSASPAAAPVAGDPTLTVEPRPPRADGRPVYLIRFAPRAPGVVRAALTLAGGGEVPVVGVGFQTLLAFPAELAPSGVTAPGAARTITIKAVGDAPLEITRVELPADITGDLVATTPGREWRLAVHARGSQAGETQPIRIHTNAAADPVLVIPVQRTNQT